MTIQRLPDLDFLRQCFRLDPETGKLFWKVRPASHFSSSAVAVRVNTRISGTEAFKSTHRGYRKARLVDGKPRKVAAHRIVFALTHGREPEGIIDHINGDASDNRPENLREATAEQNMANRGRKKGKKLPKGVFWYPVWGPKYVAILGHNRRRICLGKFDTIEQAHRAYSSVAMLVQGDFYCPDQCQT